MCIRGVCVNGCNRQGNSVATCLRGIGKGILPFTLGCRGRAPRVPTPCWAKATTYKHPSPFTLHPSPFTLHPSPFIKTFQYPRYFHMQFLPFFFAGRVQHHTTTGPALRSGFFSNHCTN